MAIRTNQKIGTVCIKEKYIAKYSLKYSEDTNTLKHMFNLSNLILIPYIARKVVLIMLKKNLCRR